MFSTIRRYRTTQSNDVTRRVNQNFVHAIGKQPGFVAYYAIDTGEGEWMSVSVFQTRQAAEESNRMAAAYILREDMGEVLGEPVVTTGEVVVHAQASGQ